MPDLNRLLFGPGPTNVPDDTLAALAKPTIGHLDPQFLAIMDRIGSRLKATFQTQNALTFCLSAPGSVGMESSLVNLLSPGDTAVACINGVFGGRMRDICTRIGANVVAVEDDWGRAVDTAKLGRALDAHPEASLVAFVHAETSTGVRSDAKAIAALAKQHDCLVVMDCVTSLSGVPVEVDAWGIDVAYSGSQKCLSCVPGLSPVTFSAAAVDRIRKRSSPVQSWFCDVSLLMDYYESGSRSRAYHHTAPVNSLYALDAALAQVEDEGLEARFARHRDASEHLYSCLDDLGLDLVVAPQERLYPLTLVRIPDAVNDGKVRRYLLDERNIELGAGLGAFAGKAWRIGLMGMNATRDNAELIAGELDRAIRRTAA